MVCVTCFLIPIGLWIWFQFIYPVLLKIKSLIFPDAQAQDDDKKDEVKKYECPFDFCKKKPTENQSEVKNDQLISQEEKKDL
ncbi:unnamed protein product [Brachionus calyciflorus]|uniref:Transmembrane protein n=1 Tax=Brachionus calyciflorus TaxID=104777 RepID=A0A813YX48_9BILA|nr:unnamed protein product [Brachionus calyciflorus]